MDEDLQKGQAVKNQKALWDKALKFRFLLQKAFSSSNRLPQEPIRTLFCDTDNEVREAYSDLLTSSKKTLDSILELQQALLENNPSIMQPAEANYATDSKQLEASGNSNGDNAEEWLQISQMQSRIASFRNKSIDKWQRKTQVTTGTDAIKDKLHAFNQSISQQVAAYMRDPSKMIKGMRQNRSAVAVFGNVPDSADSNNQEETGTNGDPELLDDPEFYQQLLKEFFETIDPSSSETAAFYALKRLQIKKRKIVDRRASKSHKQRYHVHEKIANFMAPQRWTKMVGGEKQGRVYGLAGMASQRFLKSTTYTPSEREQQLETKLDAMKVKLTQLQVQMDTLNDFKRWMQHQTPPGTTSFSLPIADMIYPTTIAPQPYAHCTTSSARLLFNPPHSTHNVDSDTDVD